MRWLAAFISLAVPGTGMTGFVRELDWHRPPPPERPIHDPEWPPEMIVVPLGTDLYRKDLGDCGRPLCPSLWRQAEPLVPLDSLFMAKDYPPGLEEARGRMSVSLRISARGRVLQCRVLDSIAAAAHDRATCAILRARARFRPARTVRGIAVAGYYGAIVQWRPQVEVGTVAPRHEILPPAPATFH